MAETSSARDIWLFRSSGCMRALSRKIWEFFEEFLWQGWMRNWLDIKLNFFFFGSGIENFLRISLKEKIRKRYLARRNIVCEDWKNGLEKF